MAEDKQPELRPGYCFMETPLSEDNEEQASFPISFGPRPGGEGPGSPWANRERKEQLILEDQIDAVFRQRPRSWTSLLWTNQHPQKRWR
jgi:hypothetical protein